MANNGSDPQTIPGMASRLGQSLITALPPAFVMLLLINAVFIATVMWFLNNQMDARNKLVGTLLDRCMEIALQGSPPGYQQMPRAPQ